MALMAASIPFGAAERRRLETDGFVTLPNIVSPAGVGALNSAIDNLLARGGGGPPGGEDGWTGAWLWDDEIGSVLWEVASSPAVVALMREICGPNVCLWAGGLATKAPTTAGQEVAAASSIPWHQDAPYWNIYPERHGVVWVALEEVSAHNGTVAVLPGYHRRGCLPRFHDHERGGFNHNIRADALPPADVLDRLKVDYEFSAGTGAVHDIMMPHTSGPNLSGRPRRAFNLRYCSAEGVLGQNTYTNPLTGEGKPREYILVCGEDTAGRGFGREPSWMNGGLCYTGEPGIDASRHERPAGEPGSYALTNLAASSAAADSALGPTTGGGTEAKL